MSTATLTGLRDYLCDTLTPANMVWLATELMEYGRKQEEQSVKPYTMEEIHARIAQSERDSAAGKVHDFDQVMQELEEEFAHEDSLELAEAV